MKNKVDLITFASWEERFLERFYRNLTERPISKAVIYYLDEFSAWSETNRNEASKFAKSKGVEVVEIALRVSSPAENWLKMREVIPRTVVTGGHVLVDLTTMPREFIWSILWFLDFVRARVEFVYSKPAEYNKEWLSRDPQRPRLVYKMSGIADPSKRVCLIVIAGFDVERTHQLVTFFEPTVTFLGLQQGDNGSINNSKMAENKRRFGGEPDRCCFNLDAYSEDQGEADILKQIGSYFDSHNVIMSSLGPKLSAVALYRIQRRYPQAALAYAPSREFNRSYSTGLGPSFWGQLA